MYKILLAKGLLLLSVTATANHLVAEPHCADTLKLNYGSIYGYALKGNIKPSLALLDVDSGKQLSDGDKAFIQKFRQRFKYAHDQSNYLAERKSKIDTLLIIFRDYWRSSLEDNNHSYDTMLTVKLSEFFVARYHLKILQKSLPTDTLDKYTLKYVASMGLHTNGFGKVGKYYDLLVWRNQKDTSYTFSVLKEKIVAPMVFMEDFISLGWEDYATLGRHYPGGWTTHEAIFAIEKAYDKKSESFLVGLLAHEGRHFADYTAFPNLGSADLEYRAKLVELSLYKNSIYQKIQFFINEADHSTYNNSHSFADYCLIRDLSELLFKVEFETDITKWRGLAYPEINDAARVLLQRDTEDLKKNPGVKNYIQ